MTLDIDLKQIFVQYDEDENFTWHHRVLMKRIEGTSWVVLTPDLEVEVLDLAGRQVLPLRRRAPFPAAQINDAYIFDPIVPGDLDHAKREATMLAALYADIDAEEWEWVVSEQGHNRFGEVVPAGDIEDDEKMTVGRNKGVWSPAPDEELHVERIEKDKLDE